VRGLNNPALDHLKLFWRHTTRGTLRVRVRATVAFPVTPLAEDLPEYILYRMRGCASLLPTHMSNHKPPCFKVIE
jgi:hypothetical protein